MTEDSTDRDALQLSAGAIEALQQFYAEKDVRAKQFEELKSQAENRCDQTLSIEAFPEDWNASQFWYSDETATALAKELLDSADAESHIAVVSAPSVFIQLKNLITSGKYSTPPEIILLEYDDRFAVFSEFVPYDYQNPIRLPAHLKGKFDRIICDPPFLSDDCQTKAALTVRWLSREAPSPSTGSNDSFRLVICTGERMEETIKKLYTKCQLRTTDYEVKHGKGLSNEFRCFANFECDAWKFASDSSE